MSIKRYVANLATGRRVSVCFEQWVSVVNVVCITHVSLLPQSVRPGYDRWTHRRRSIVWRLYDGHVGQNCTQGHVHSVHMSTHTPGALSQLFVTSSQPVSLLIVFNCTQPGCAGGNTIEGHLLTLVANTHQINARVPPCPYLVHRLVGTHARTALHIRCSRRGSSPDMCTRTSHLTCHPTRADQFHISCRC
jgi:hypothetical protein